jgi:dephospho-CoA kinase
MEVIGLSGKICSGKDTAAAYLEQKGFLVVDVDRLGHEELERNREAVIRVFGEGIRSASGSVVRKALAEEVFSSRTQLFKLEQLLHPAMAARCREIIAAAEESEVRGVVLNAAVLVKIGLDVLCDSIIFVTAPFIIRFRRAIAYRKIGWGDFFRRNYRQRDIVPKKAGGVEKSRVFRADNSGLPAGLHKNLDSILNILDSSREDISL